MAFNPDTYIQAGATGLAYSGLAQGIWLSFRVLNLPDLTVAGSLAVGGAVSGILITAAGWQPLATLPVALLVGMLAGLATGLLHTKLKINALLASILVMTGLYTITLRVMSIGAAGGIRSELSLYNGTEAQLRDLLAWLPLSVQQRSAIIMAAIAIVLTLLLYWLMSSQLGLAMRATGVNEQMARSVGINTDNMKMLLLAVSNGMVAVSGALVAQNNSYTDANVGNTAIVVGLAAVILGEVVVRSAAVGWALIGALLGSVIYHIAVQIALAQQVQVTDTQLVTALLVIFALALPQIGGQFKRLGQRRSTANLPTHQRGRLGEDAD